MKKGYSLIEVLLALAILGLAGSLVLEFIGKFYELSISGLKTTLCSVLVHNSINEIVFEGKTFNDKELECAGQTFTIKQDFESIANLRVLKVICTQGNVEIYEVR